MIKIRGVSKQYGNFKAIDDVSLSIPENQLTSLIGPNGAGKSTLLSIMSRLIPKDRGDVVIDGLDVSGWASNDLAKRISILRQANPLNLRLSVRDLVTFGRFPYSQGRVTKEDERHIDQAIETMNVQHLQYKFLDQLSGGERQRAFIAMLIAQDTDYILLDEPLNNLDMKHAVQIMKVLRHLVDDLKKTIVLVLHDINFASAYSDRIVAMKNGRIVRDGPVDQIIESSALKDVYDMDIQIREVDCQRVCVYYW